MTPLRGAGAVLRNARPRPPAAARLLSSQPPQAPTVGVVGVGAMGAAAAISFKRAGCRVLLQDGSAERHDTAEANADLERLGSWLEENQPRSPDAPAVGTLEWVGPEVAALDAERPDVVMECVAEDLDAKVALLRQLPGCVERDALLLTVTSGLSIAELGAQSGTEAVLVGAHFYNPAHLMPLVEIVNGPQTPDAKVDEACALMESIGKITVRCKDVPGFIGNRLLHAMWRESIYLVQEGIASPADIDRVARLTFGLRLPAMGPLENMDIVGREAATPGLAVADSDGAVAANR